MIAEPDRHAQAVQLLEDAHARRVITSLEYQTLSVLYLQGAGEYIAGRSGQQSLSQQQELVGDLLAIVHVSSCRLYGLPGLSVGLE